VKVTLKTITPDAEVNIVEIARVSSPRKDKTEAPEGLLNYLIRNKHWSPFEHSHLSFEIVTSKVIALQFMRHVSFRFQDFSRRYAVVQQTEPIEFRLQAEKNRQSSTTPVGHLSQDEEGTFFIDMEKDSTPEIQRWLEKVAINMATTFDLYDEGLNLGIARECASMILPLSMQTTMFMTGSIRSWIHLLEVRDDHHAQKEAQLIAQEIKKVFKEQLPIISKALNY
jgi:thymidylate synthase (FAD)